MTTTITKRNLREERDYQLALVNAAIDAVIEVAYVSGYQRGSRSQEIDAVEYLQSLRAQVEAMTR